MTYLTRSAFALAFATLLPLSNLTGQSSAPIGPDAASALLNPDPALIGELWATAEGLRSQGRLTESLAEYQEIARIQSEAFQNAATTYWMMAEIHNALGDDRSMARVLDAAADHAGRFGDYDTRARSLFEAAVAYAKVRDQKAANDRMDMLRTLMDTQPVSDDLRAGFAARTGRSIF
jgi:hypothetical protein